MEEESSGCALEALVSFLMIMKVVQVPTGANDIMSTLTTEMTETTQMNTDVKHRVESRCKARRT